MGAGLGALLTGGAGAWDSGGTLWATYGWVGDVEFNNLTLRVGQETKQGQRGLDALRQHTCADADAMHDENLKHSKLREE
ncbi:hypothetical protein H0H92_008837 [Tricholoma furcatifolium]|nr:hypothetical protein H0H92_008837 [Tricholoma furcatifolium]